MPPASRSVDRVQPYFSQLFAQDASGSRWLGELLSATPLGQTHLGELAEAPGWLVTPLAVRGASGRLAAFEHPVMPPRDLLRWYIDHPDALTWCEDADASPYGDRLRRALLCDDPPGSQVKAQDRARDLLATRSALAPEWWRFEGTSLLDCVLITDRLVVTVVGKRADPLQAASPWYPKRTELVRALEAARHVAAHRRWATVLISDEPIPGGSPDDLVAVLPAAAPHLGAEDLRAMHEAYLGNVTWAQACGAVELPLSALPDGPAQQAA
jgi:hypothetical protein